MAVLKEKSQHVWNVLSGRPVLFFGLFVASLMVLMTVYQAIHMEIYFPSTILLLAGAGFLALAAALYLILYRAGHFSRALCWVLVLSVCGTNIYYMGSMYSLRSMIEAMCAPMSQKPGVMSIYCSKQAPITSLSRLNGARVGFLQARNDLGNQRVIEDLARENIEIQAMYYPNMEALFTALKGQSVSAICLNDYDLDLLDLLDPDTSARKSTQLIDSFQYPQNPLYGDPLMDLSSQPFTALIKVSGSSRDRIVEDLALAVINPNSRLCKIFLIPRDFWIDYGCENGVCSFESDRLALIGGFSDGQLISAITKLLGVSINFMIDLSLDSLLDSLSNQSLTITNPAAFSSGMTSFEAGELSLNAEKTRIFAGMFDLSQTDRNYMHNAYLVLKALWEQYPIQSLDLIGGELDRLNDSLKTDFSYDQFVHLIKTITYSSSQWQFEEEEFGGSDQTFYSNLLTAETYGISPDPAQLANAKSQIEEILGISTQNNIEPAPSESQPAESEAQEPDQQPENQLQENQEQENEETELYDPGYGQDDGYESYGLEEGVYE